ncbi:MAG: sugar ABC transporter substrate-binding protein [Actinomycetaceae bacterium]|nr:sugar ABC transporter substrate-binding protein [Actinomycetaceae bacterium]
MRLHTKAIAGVGALALLLTACSPATPAEKDSTDAPTEVATVTFRLWDEVAAPYYEESFEAFEAENPDINVEVELVPWAQYWEQLPLDISSGEMADIFWVNSSNFALYADNGNLINISEDLNPNHDEWQQSVVALYTRNGSLWGVPQLWDSIAMFYNVDMLDEAGIDPTTLTWAPGAGEEDTFLPALQQLTKDTNGNTADSADFDPENIATYGFNAQADLQAIYLNFLGSNGAEFQGDDDQFNFNTPEGIAAFQYIVDLINTHHVAPPTAETNTNGDFSRDLFIRGELALFQSGPYNLRNIADNTDVNWSLAPMVAGPEGRVGVVHGVAAVGNAQTENLDATLRVLEWLGSAEGQHPIAANGVAFPGVVEAQDAFVDYWAREGIDVSMFITAASGNTINAPRGAMVNAGIQEVVPHLLDMFLGNATVEDALQAAQDAGNTAME